MLLNKTKLTLTLLLLMMVTIVPMTQAQESGVELTSPLAVTELFGEVTFEGTAAVPGMQYYYLEAHPLTESLALDESTPWIPLSVAIEDPVVNGTLAVIDSTRIDDGLYALRLTVNTADGQTFHSDIGPVRVSNARFAAMMDEGDNEPEAVQLPMEPPTAPTPTGVTATSFQPGSVSPNVRYCDIVDNVRCPIIDHLDRNETARLVARSSRTGGWYKIRLSSGHEGWISESVVIIQGDTGSLPTEAPPEPRPAPVVQVQQSVQPVGQSPVNSSTNAVPNGISIQGGRGVCNETFNVQVNISNPTNAVVAGGQVTVQDVNIGNGEITATNYGSFPSLNPGANFVVVVPMRTSVYYNSNHELRARAGGRDVRVQYTLEQGNCNRPAIQTQQVQAPSVSCTLTSSTGSFEGYATPGGGEVLAVIQESTLLGEEKANAAGLTWYRVNYIDTSAWIPVVGYISTSGTC